MNDFDDDLRRGLLDDDDDFGPAGDDDPFGPEEPTREPSTGMSAIQRAVLAFFGLLNVVALVVLVLVLTGRIGA